MKTLVVACFVFLCTTGASGDVLYPAALTFEPGYAVGPLPGFPLSALPSLGTLTLAGRVARVGRPFDDLLPSGAYELTYVFEGSALFGAGDWDGECSGGVFAVFEGGTVSIYLDPTPDADFGNLATFRDGDVVLLALSSHIWVRNNDPQAACPWLPDEPDISAVMQFVEGLWFDRVSNHGEGFEASSHGELDGNVSQELKALGFVFRADGTVDINGPVPVTPATWGAVKALYR
jgi:hypothetical protein